MGRTWITIHSPRTWTQRSRRHAAQVPHPRRLPAPPARPTAGRGPRQTPPAPGQTPGLREAHAGAEEGRGRLRHAAVQMLRARVRGPLSALGGPVPSPPQLPPRGVAHEVDRVLGPERPVGQEGDHAVPSSSLSRRQTAEVPRDTDEVWLLDLVRPSDRLFLTLNRSTR